MQIKNDTDKIISRLKDAYPNAKTNLMHKNPFELLIATILSAQSTDRQVNQITKGLFQKYSTPFDFLALQPEELEVEIKGCGLFRNKSKNIIAACRILLEKHGGEVPEHFEDLVSLPGVGRKTANVVLSSGFGKNTIAVDTHVFRVANRLGLADSRTPLGTEKDLQKVIPENMWSLAHHWLIFHGREVCSARNPRCGTCFLNDLCSYFIKRHDKPKS